MCGLWTGLIIGFITEYYTSNRFSPVLELVEACRMGAAPNIILGLALGYASTIIPILAIACTIYFSLCYAGMYGVALAAIGMLGCLPIALTIDGYGPISDNAGGISEMAPMKQPMTAAIAMAKGITIQIWVMPQFAKMPALYTPMPKKAACPKLTRPTNPTTKSRLTAAMAKTEMRVTNFV